MIRTMLVASVRPFRTMPSESGAQRWLPLVLAVLAGAWALRGVKHDDLFGVDPPRHALNGAFVHDAILTGNLTSPLQYGKQYYSRVPALTIPVHPPVFAAIEALFFFVLGVNVFAARLAVALATAFATLMLYRLIWASHKSHAIAVAATVTFLSIEQSRIISGTVLLEFPALVFLICALYCLLDVGTRYSMRSGILFAVVSGIAVWTKQQTVFVGMVPILLFLISRRPRLLMSRTLWVSTALFGVSVLSLLYVMNHVKGAMSNVSNDFSPPNFVTNLGSHFQWFSGSLGLPFAVLTTLSVVYFLLAPRRHEERHESNDIYLSWSLSGLLLFCLFDRFVVHRYMLLIYPPLIVIGYSGLNELSGRLLGAKRSWFAPVAAACVYFAIGFSSPVYHINGPAKAAQIVVRNSPGRVLFCGNRHGSFCFAVRSLDPKLTTVVIRAEKLADFACTSEKVDEFAHKYGASYIVIDPTPNVIDPTPNNEPWMAVVESPSASMLLVKRIPIRSTPTSGLCIDQPNRANTRGHLYVYQFTRPSANPRQVDYDLPGVDVPVRF